LIEIKGDIMKFTGIVRKVDELGRIVLPMELRRSLNIDVGDSIEVFADGDQIILRKSQPADIFTGSAEDLIDFHGKKVSKETIKELAKLAELI